MRSRSFLIASIGALVLAVTLVSTPSVQAAATHTWTGGSATSSDWTDPDNWDVGAPVAGDSLVFPNGAARKGNTNNFPAGTAFLNITFTGGGYEIDGNALNLTGTLTNSAPSGATNVLRLSIDGPGLVSSSSGRLALTAPNGYNGSTVVLSGATLLVSGSGTLGNTAGSSTVSNGGRLQLANNVDLGDETLLVVGSGPGGLGSLQSLSGTNRVQKIQLNGDITIAVGQSTLILTDVAQAGSGEFRLIGGGKLQIEGMTFGINQVVVEHGNLTWNAPTPAPVLVEEDGWLRGIGTVGSVNSQGGLVWPGNGNAPGVLTAGAVSLAGGAFRVDLDGPTVGTGYGQLVTGAFALPGSVTKLELDLQYQPSAGQAFTIVNSASPVSGTFHGLAEGATVAVSGYAFSITYKGGTDGNDIVLTVLRQVAADLAASITAEPSVAVPGQTITYTLGMHNAGPDAASTPRFTIGMPAGTTFVSVNAPGWTCSTPHVGSAGSLTCTGSTLAAGASASIVLTVRVNPGATGTVSATVATFSNTNDPKSIDNSANLVLPVSQGTGELPFRRFLPAVARDGGW
jgi:fibronectin-binding autotransporter adhesin